MSTLVDTNLLLRISDPNHSQYNIAMQAIAILHARGEELYIAPQNLYEYWVVATRPLANNGLGFAPKKTHTYLIDIKQTFPLLADTEDIYDRWETLVSSLTISGKKAHDARLVAAMQCHDISHILTFNHEDFAHFPGITALAPEYAIL